MIKKHFIKKRRYLVWYVKNPENLSQEAIVEAVLNYGDFDDVKKLFSILGIKKVAEIFRQKSKSSKIGRQNYRERAKNYFSLYFNKHVPI